MAIGGVPAGIYASSAPKECHYILENTEASVLIVENLSKWSKIESYCTAESLPKLHHIILMDPPSSKAELAPRLLSWPQFLSLADGKDLGKIDEFANKLDLEVTCYDLFPLCVSNLAPSLATLVYTSGTSGPPKGVMLSHRNLAWTSRQATEVVGVRGDDSNLSFLPLSHIAEQMFSIHIPAQKASTTYYCESMVRLTDNLVEVRPTIFFCVPRLWEKFRDVLSHQLGSTEPASLPEAHKRRLLAALGLDRVRFALCGAAPVSAGLLGFFDALGLQILEIYGQSEGTGPASFNTKQKALLGTAGPPFPGVQIKTAEDGEILVKGPNIFMGYWRDPASTAAGLRDGWLLTGDLGHVDQAGFLRVTGRKKDIIITSGGKNIGPAAIELALAAHPLIADAVVIGDGRNYLTALLSLDLEIANRVALDKGLPVQIVLDSPVTHQSLVDHVAKVNQDLAQAEQIKKFRILPRNLDIANDELTATRKLKRAGVNRNWASLIEEMYSECSIARCACGSVELRTKRPAPAWSVYCHCTNCRRCHAADYVSLCGYAPEDLEISKGSEQLAAFITGTEVRHSCKTCAAPVMVEMPRHKARATYLSSFVLPNHTGGKVEKTFAPTAHIFYAEGISQVNDNLPKYIDLPAAFGGSGKEINYDRTYKS